MDEEIGKEIGARIKAERMRRNMTLVELATALGVGRTTIQNLEAKPLTVRVGVLRKACEALNLDPNYVLGLEPKTYVDDFGIVHKTEAMDVGL